MEHQYHRELKATVAAYLRKGGFTVHEEYKLPNGRIADIIATSKDGSTIIIEVKTELSHVWMSDVLRKYDAYASALYVATDKKSIEVYLKGAECLISLGRQARIGFLGIERDSVTVMRQSTPVRERHGMVKIASPVSVSAARR